MKLKMEWTAVAIGVALLISAGCHSAAASAGAVAPAKTDIAVTRVARTHLQRTLELESELKPFQEIDIYAKEAGYVNPIYVDVGDHVTAGQLLAKLEIPELNDQLQQAGSAVVADQQEVQQAQQELDRSQAAYKLAHLTYTRLSDVIKSRPNLVAQQEVDTAAGADEQAQAQVGASTSGLAAAQARFQAAQSAEKQVQTLLAYTQITAPFTGVITARYADNGALLQAGIASHLQAMPLVKLSQNDLLRLVIPVPEVDVAAVRLREPVQVRVPALQRVYAGTVARMSQSLDLDTRTMHTEVDVPNPGLTLDPGMYAYASLVLADAPNALAVPVQSVIRDGASTRVWIIRADGHVESREVRTGLETSSQVQILAGLEEGDTVAVSGTSGLRAGDVVQPHLITPATGQVPGGAQP